MNDIEHTLALNDVMIVAGLFPTWISEIFSGVPSLIAMQLSLNLC